MKSSYVNLFDIFTIVSVMIIFGSAVTIFLSIYIITVIFLLLNLVLNLMQFMDLT